VVHIVASGVKRVNVVPCLAELLNHNWEADVLGEVRNAPIFITWPFLLGITATSVKFLTILENLLVVAIVSRNGQQRHVLV